MRTCYRICRRNGAGAELNLTRHLEERVSLSRRHVSLFIPALFTVECQIEHGLMIFGEKTIESVEFAARVREGAASAHYLMKVVWMCRVERYKDLHDRLPRIGSLRHEPVTADVTRGFTGFANPGELNSIRRPIWRDYCIVEDSRVLRESRDND